MVGVSPGLTPQHSSYLCSISGRYSTISPHLLPKSFRQHRFNSEGIPNSAAMRPVYQRRDKVRNVVISIGPLKRGKADGTVSSVFVWSDVVGIEKGGRFVYSDVTDIADSWAMGKRPHHDIESKKETCRRQGRQGGRGYAIFDAFDSRSGFRTFSALVR
jgi:hypothetical protein